MSRHLRHAAGLAVLAPLIAEAVASANTPAFLFPAVLPLLVLIYGLPALLIRELWVRRRIGWPGFVVLGAAYTAFNEGLVAATWFKIDSDRGKVLAFTAAQAGRAHGVNWAVVSNLIAYHTIWSLLIPIVLMSAWAGRAGAREPWLPRWALGVCTALVALVALGSLSDQATHRVCAAPPSQPGVLQQCTDGRRWAVVLIVVGVLVALALPRRRLSRAHTWRPPDRWLWWVGAAFSVAFLASYFVLPLAGHPVASELVAPCLLGTGVLAVTTWARAPSWTMRAAVVLATGAMIPGMLLSLRAFAVGQPVVVALFVWLFLRPLLLRCNAEEADLDERPVAAPAGAVPRPARDHGAAEPR